MLPYDSEHKHFAPHSRYGERRLQLLLPDRQPVKWDEPTVNSDRSNKDVHDGKYRYAAHTKPHPTRLPDATNRANNPNNRESSSNTNPDPRTNHK